MEVKMENMSFKDLAALREAFGMAEVDHQGDVALFNSSPVISQRQLSNAARKTKKVVDITLHAPGAIKEMRDGTRYQVQDNGAWVKI